MRLKYFAWLIAAATPAAAFAQTSVTLYGRIDGGVEYLNHIAKPNGGSGTRWSAESGDWGTSMFGLKGVEDLGGGLSTVFNLETAFQVMNGQTGGGRMWSRRAYVGLKSNTWGQLQAGRNLFIDSDGVWEFDPFVQQAFSSASLVRGRNWQQTSNNIEYHSPVIGGFDVQAQYAFGNQSRGFNYGAPDDFGRSDGIMISYHSPVLDVRGIYDELRDNNGKFSNVFTASREYFVGANVKVSKFKIQGAYTHYQAPDSPAGVADRADHYWLGATYSATPQWAVTGGRVLREGRRRRRRCVARSVGARDDVRARYHVQSVETYVPVWDGCVCAQRREFELLAARDAAGCDVGDEPDDRRVADGRVCGDDAYVLSAGGLLR